MSNLPSVKTREESIMPNSFRFVEQYCPPLAPIFFPGQFPCQPRLSVLCLFLMDIANFSDQFTRIIVVFLPFLLGIILHEISHGLAAWRCGDPTARMAGRLTMNPLPHIDPVGMGCFIVTSLFTPFVFGWAKPVPVNARYFRHPRRDMAIVSAAGPLCNFLIAVLLALCLRILLLAPHSFLETSSANFLAQMLLGGISANLILGWFNLIPIPPLDGGHILACLLPQDIAWKLERMGRTGFLVLAVLLMTGAINFVLLPLLNSSYRFLLTYAAGI